MSDPFYLNDEIVEHVLYSYMTFSETFWFETIYKIDRKKSNEKLWLSLIENELRNTICQKNPDLYDELLNVLFLSNTAITGSWIFHLLQVKLANHQNWSPGDIDLFTVEQPGSEEKDFLSNFLKKIAKAPFFGDQNGYSWTRGIIEDVTNYQSDYANIKIQLVKLKKNQTVFVAINDFDLDLCKFSVFSKEKGKLSLYSTDTGVYQLLHPEKTVLFLMKDVGNASPKRILKYFERGVNIQPSSEVWKEFKENTLSKNGIHLYASKTTQVQEMSTLHHNFYRFEIKFEPYESVTKKRKRSESLNQFVKDMQKNPYLGCLPDLGDRFCSKDPNTVIFKLCIECTERNPVLTPKTGVCCLHSIKEKGTQQKHLHFHCLGNMMETYTLFYNDI